MNGSSTPDWIRIEAAGSGSVYGSSWYQRLAWRRTVGGNEEDFRLKKEGTILGNLGLLISHIREKSPEAGLLVMNPVERVILSIFWIL